MKLKVKLPLAFAIANGLLFLAGLFGIWQLSASITTFEIEVLRSVSAHKKAAEVNNAFAIAIQEWKNVLLRGKNSGDQTKYWAAHQKEVAESQKLLQELSALVGDGPSQSTVQKLTGALSTAASGYAKAYEAFKAADADHTAGDAAAKGADREAIATLKELRKQLSEQEVQATEAAVAGAATARQAALLLMCLITGLGVVGGVWLSRKIVSPLEQAVQVANTVAEGDLSQPIEAKSADEI
ncbi:MAG: hypothetical protein QG643_1782, partial [Pseudomonadota bacterium]|nr:hypothetical protein [Pseudomonadota bacterium]